MPPCSTRSATCSTSSARARVQLTGLAVREQRERHAPATLSRDAPVGTAGDHAGDALLAPVGHPVHLADLLERGGAQPCLLHADEPLRRGAEDHRRLVTPAVRVAVAEGLVVQQRPRSAEHLDDVRVRVEDLLAREQRRGRQEPPVGTHRIVHRQAVALADDEVLLAVAGRRVHGTGTAVERHVLAQDHRHLAIVERVPQREALERGALDARDLGAAASHPHA